MSEGQPATLPSSAPYPSSARLIGRATAIWLGVLAATLATLFVSVHWSIALVAGIVVLVLSAIEEEWFLLFVIFLLPLNWIRPSGTLRDVMTLLRLAVVVGFFGGRYLRGELRWSELTASKASHASLAFLVLAFASVTFGTVGWVHSSTGQIYRLVSWVGFYFFGLAWINSARRLQRVLVVLLASICLLGFFAAVQEAVGGYTRLWLYLNPPGPDSFPWAGRASSLLGYATQLAAYLDLALPFALATCVIAKGSLRKLGGLALALGLLTLLFTQSVGGLTSFVAVLTLAIYCFVQPWRRRILLFLGLVLIAGALVVARKALNPAHFASESVLLAHDVFGRLIGYYTGWLLFLRHPFLGVGFGNYGPAAAGLLPSFHWILPRDRTEAWNLYLNLLAETGIAGTLAFLYMLYLAVREAWKHLRVVSWPVGRIIGFGTLGAITGVLVHGCVAYSLFTQYGAFLWLIIALCQLQSRDPHYCSA